MDKAPIKAKSCNCSFLEGSKGTGGVPPPPSVCKGTHINSFYKHYCIKHTIIIRMKC